MNDILLLTAFSCMSCDGDIAPEEVALLKQMDAEQHLFGDIVFDDVVKGLVERINKEGKSFLSSYIVRIGEADFSEEEELKILDVAVKTIKADNIIQYSELKFFKVIKENLKITDESILEKVEGVDEKWVAQDIKNYGFLYDSYFNNIELPQFDLNEIKIEDKSLN